MRHPMVRIRGPFDPRRTRWTSAASVANQREYRHRASGGTIFGASKRPTTPARISAPSTTSTTSRYLPNAVTPDGSSRMTNPRAITRPTPTPRSITALVTALRQSLPSRTSSQARTPSPATLGKTWAKNTPTAVAATMAIRVICLSRAPSESTILYQRRPESGISSMATKIASAAQRKSSSGMTDQTWFRSICRETYQRHAPVTSNLAAKIATFSPLPPRDRPGISKSLPRWYSIRTLSLTLGDQLSFTEDVPEWTGPLAKRVISLQIAELRGTPNLQSRQSVDRSRPWPEDRRRASWCGR